MSCEFCGAEEIKENGFYIIHHYNGCKYQRHSDFGKYPVINDNTIFHLYSSDNHENLFFPITKLTKSDSL